jgi:hypothetical protein
MAATNRYISLNPGHLRVGKVVETSAGTSTDEIELRMLVIKADGTTHTNLTRYSVIQALEVFRKYLLQGGYIEFNNAASPGLPQPSPGPTQV